MPCQTCATTSALQVCLFCGHSFCAAHRTERDGVACCTACNEAEHARASGRAKATSARVGEALGTPVPGAGSDRLQAAVAEAGKEPPTPLPEAGWWPLLAGVAAAAVAGAYLWWLTRWLGAPGYAPHAATGAGAAFVFGAVWIIVKAKLS